MTFQRINWFLIDKITKISDDFFEKITLNEGGFFDDKKGC